MPFRFTRIAFLTAALVPIALLIGLSPLRSTAAEKPVPESYWVYFGTYTDAKGSKGIYRAKMDAKTGRLGEAELAAEMGSPSFLTIHPSKPFLYAVGEGRSKDGGPVVAFALDPKSGTLTQLNEDKSGGAGPCHISIHPAGTYATVANYGGGSTAVFKLDADGKLAGRTAFVQHAGTGPDKSRREAPHAHCSFFVPAGNRLLTADLGLDRLKIFAFDPATGQVNDDAAADAVMPPGCGPRHIALTPNGEYAYVCGELDSTVNVVKLDPKGGKPAVIQSLSTLPHPVKGNSTAECVRHPSGKFVYVSNRGHNSVAVFRVGDDNKLTAAGYITGDIKTPRNFNVDPSGRWMLIASQDGGKVGVYELDPATGLAKETPNTVKVSRCVCVKFVPVAK